MEMTIQEMKQGATNAQHHLERLLHKNNEILSNEQVKPYLKSTLQTLLDAVNRTHKAKRKSDVRLAFNEVVSASNTVQLLIEDTETFLKMLPTL